MKSGWREDHLSGTSFRTKSYWTGISSTTTSCCSQSLHSLPARVDIVASEHSEASDHYQHCYLSLTALLSSVSKSIHSLLVTKRRLFTNEAVYVSSRKVIV